jgi:spore maturation protein SpmA
MKRFACARETVLKQSVPTSVVDCRMAEEKMRSLIFRALLLAVVAAGFGALVSSSFAAVRHARSATFSERFAPVLDQMKKPAGAASSQG